MYAANDETPRCHSLKHLGVGVEKCFILTPTYHFVNPTFPQVPSHGPYHLSSALPQISSRDLDLAPDSPVKVSAVSDPLLSTVFRSPNVVVPSQPVTPSQTNALSPCDHPIPTVSPALGIVNSPKSIPSNQSVSAASQKSLRNVSMPALAKSFARLLEDSPEQAVGLAEAAAELGVERQRIDEIAEILEGIGLIAKQESTSVYCLVNGATQSVECRRDRVDSYPSSSDSDGVGGPPKLNKTVCIQSSPYFATLRDELDILVRHERQVDSFIGYLTRELERFKAEESTVPGCARHSVLDPHNHLYVRHEDIMALPGYASQTILGVRAPTGTTLEVPDPDKRVLPGVRRFEIHLTSRTAQQKNGRSEPINVEVIRPRVSLNYPRATNRRTPIYVEDTYQAQHYARYRPSHGESSQSFGRNDNGPYRGPNTEINGHRSRKRPYSDVTPHDPNLQSYHNTNCIR